MNQRRGSPSGEFFAMKAANSAGISRRTSFTSTWTVDQLAAVDDEALGERRQPRLGGGPDGPAGPLHRSPGIGVEPFDLRPAAGRGVVIAAHTNGADVAQALDDRIRSGSIAHDIAEVPDRIHRTGVGEDSVQGREIGMDVREDGDPHGEVSLAGGQTRVGGGVRASSRAPSRVPRVPE